jgi:hypothetical protein
MKKYPSLILFFYFIYFNNLLDFVLMKFNQFILFLFFLL